ncbi:GNAT family N-acetyltransferase [Chloroflexota bacterium]
MSISPYSVRNYKPADFDKYVLLTIDAEKLEPTGRCISSHVLSEYLCRPNYSPQQDLFIVETAGNTVGYMDITTEQNIGRIILNFFIYPDHRNHSLSSILVDYAMHRAKELGVRVAHVNILQDDIVAKSVISVLGFKPVRRFLQLGLDISQVRWQDIDQDCLLYRHFQRGDEEKLTQIQNRSFAGTWGYNPNTVEEINYLVNLTNFSPEDIVLAWDGAKFIGYCWTRTVCKADSEERIGQVLMLGVNPDYQCRGVGKGVLLAGLSHMKDKGLQFVELTLDNKNKAAYNLYLSVGFKIQTSSLWYEKRIG